MATKIQANIDWHDIKDVELVRLNYQCMSLAVQLMEILLKVETPNKVDMDIATPFKLANDIYSFVTFNGGA